MACTLDHCYISGRHQYSVIPPNTVEIGLGLHNELVSNYGYLSGVYLDQIFLSREFGS